MVVGKNGSGEIHSSDLTCVEPKLQTPANVLFGFCVHFVKAVKFETAEVKKK